MKSGGKNNFEGRGRSGVFYGVRVGGTLCFMMRMGNLNVFCSAWDPFNFDGDPDPWSAQEEINPDPGYYFKIYWIFLINRNFKILFDFFIFKCGER